MSFKYHKTAFHHTPKIIKVILILTIFFNILLCIIPYNYLIYLLGLSVKGINQYFFWQPLTSLFIIGDPSITFGYLFHLLFNLYIIWSFGISIIELKSNSHYIYIVLFSAFFASLLALASMLTFSSSKIFFGGTIVLYTSSMAWLMLHKDAKIFLFALPFKANWLILGTMALNLASLLSKASYLYFFVFLSSVAITYLMSLIIWKTHSPFAFLRQIEKKIIAFLHKTEVKAKSHIFTQSKIYDFQTKKPVDNDEDFMDAMLNKISTHGEQSLTNLERKRMEEISRKKSRNQK